MNSQTAVQTRNLLLRVLAIQVSMMLGYLLLNVSNCDYGRCSVKRLTGNNAIMKLPRDPPGDCAEMHLWAFQFQKIYR